MRVVDHVDGVTVKGVIFEDVAAGQSIRTDGRPSYNVVEQLGHSHIREVAGDDGINEALNWVHILASNSKAFLPGTFHGTGKKHLQSIVGAPRSAGSVPIVLSCL